MAIECARKIRVDSTLEMGYYIDDCTDPWQKPETIVLQAGCRKPRQMFYAWIPTLARHYQVIRPHIRGHWDSTPAPAGYEWTIDGLATDLKNFLDALGLERVHLVGETLGGVLAYHFAYHYPERLKTLTTVTSPASRFMNSVGQTSFLRGPPAELAAGAKQHDVAWDAEVIAEMGAENRAFAEWYVNEVKNSPLEASKDYLDAGAKSELSIEELLSGIRVPTLLMMGAEHTRVITLQELQRFSRLIPRAKLVAFPGVKALCQVLMPERCAEEVIRFIREQQVTY